MNRSLPRTVCFLSTALLLGLAVADATGAAWDIFPLKPTQSDLRYGEHPRNLLDFYRAKSDKPTPVLIFFHGGGFVGGDKRIAASQGLVKQCLPAGISVVSANYRFIAGPNSQPFPGPMLDGARVVQFVRTKAREWNLDPERIALSGGSAGACMSMWIAMHDDLADAKSDDPVARQSSRVSCVVAYGGQSSLDPKWVLEQIGGNPSIHPSLMPLFGVAAAAELETPKVQAVIREASPINHASKDDPPMYLVYNTPLAGTPLPAGTPIGVSIHHAQFGKLLRDKYAELGIPCELRHAQHTPAMDEMAFLKKYLIGER
jgi:acetyl esterase/lipase